MAFVDLLLNKKDPGTTVTQNSNLSRVDTLQSLCRATVLTNVTLRRVKEIRNITTLPSLLKEYLCSFFIPDDFDLDGFYIDYHCNFPNHVHHKVHQIHPGKCLIDGSKVLIKSQHLYHGCHTCDASGKCKMESTKERSQWLNLRHSNLMTCHISMQDPTRQRVCLVFEFPGITLHDFVFRMFLAKQRVPDIISWQVLLKLSSVFIYLEQNGILPWELCHPQNVIITNQGEVKLENLLLYLPTLPGAKYQPNPSKHLSPEQVKGDSPTSKTLVWGLGCILYEINSKLTRSLSNTGLSQFPPVCYNQAVTCTRELSKLMCECLRSDPGSRPGLQDLNRKAEKYIDKLLTNNICNETNIMALMKDLDRLPLSGGFLR